MTTIQKLGSDIYIRDGIQIIIRYYCLLIRN